MALLAEYGFNEGSGTSSADSSGNSRTLTVNSAAWSTGGHTGDGLRSFSSLSAPPADNQILGPTSGVTAQTWMAWVKIAAVGSGDSPNVVGVGWSGSNFKTLYVWSSASGKWGVGCYDNGTGDDVGGNGNEYSIGSTWHHLAMTCASSGGTSVYVDGSLIDSSSGANAPRAFTSGRIGDSANNTLGTSDFIVDDVRTFDTALSATDIVTYMNTPVGGGSTSYDVTGTASATSTATGNITAKLGVSGAVAVTSSATGAITASLPVLGTASASSGASGNVTMSFDVSGTVEIVSGASGELIGNDDLAGTAEAVSGSQGTITATLSISGTSASVSGASGALEYPDGLSGTAEAVSDTSGAVTASHAVSGTIEARSTASGALIASWSVSGTASAVSGAQGDVHVSGNLPPWPDQLTMVELVNVLTVTEVTFALTLEAA